MSIILQIIIFIICLFLGYVLWLIYYGLEVWANGGRFITDCLIEEIGWFLPGGDIRRGQYIAKLISPFNEGYIGDYRYSDIRKNNWYMKVGREVLPGRIHFMFTHIFIPLIPNIIVFGLIVPLIKYYYGN